MRLDKIQPQRVHAHKEAGQRHCRRAVHRLHVDPVQTHGERDTDGVVKECPEQILVNIADGRAAQANGSRHIRQAAFHHDDIRRVDRDVRSRADRDPVVGDRQSRRVVDAVARHGDLAERFQLSDHVRLAIGQHARDHAVGVHLRADRVGCLHIVARQHD